MLFSMMVASCAPKVSFKIQRPPLQQVENIKYIEIGDFVEVKITEARTWSLTGEVQKKINYEFEGQLIEH